MSSKSNPDQTIQQIDDLLEKDQLTTRTGLKLAFSALRDAIKIVQDVGDQLSDIGKKVDTLWAFYRVAMWVAAILGVSIISLIWALIVGQAQITFGP